MEPFDSYPGKGKEKLGHTRGSNSRRGYGLKFMRKTGQTRCAYCDLNLVASFDTWLQIALDHVVPKNACTTLSLDRDWTEDCINKVLACAACNGFVNRFK